MAISKTSSADSTNTIRSSGFDGPPAWYGTKKDDIFNGTDADDWAYGRGGADQLNGNGGNDMLNGGAGGDRIDGGSGHDLIFGDDPTEKGDTHGADSLTGGAGDDVIYAGGGNDRVSGGTGVDFLAGELGDDIFDVANGELQDGDVYDGGGGSDALNIAGQGFFGTNVIDLESGIATGANGQVASVSNIEQVQAHNGDFQIIGTEKSESFNVSFGTAYLYGGGGADKLTSGGAADMLNGGAGDDVLSAGGGNDSLGDFAVAAPYIEDTGDDIYYGGAGDDRMYDGAGNDTYYGGTGFDQVAFIGNSSNFDVQDLGGGSYIITDLSSGDVNYLYEVEIRAFIDV